MGQVKIFMRDANGRRYTMMMPWEDVNVELVEQRTAGEISDEDEILLVLVGGTCIYSALTNDPITLDDLTGFFG